MQFGRKDWKISTIPCMYATNEKKIA